MAPVVALAPQTVITSVAKRHSDYPRLLGIDDPEEEQALYRQLRKLGLSEAELLAFQLRCDRKLAAYRPADPRFWRRYLALLDQLGKPGPLSLEGDAGQQLLDALRRCQNDVHLDLLADLQCRHSQFALPAWLETEFRQSLTQYLTQHSLVGSDLDPEQRKLVRQQRGGRATAQVLAYLDGQVSLEAVQQYLADTLSAKLDVGLSQYLFTLLDDERSKRLITLLLNHDCSALKLLGRGVLESIYVRRLLKAGTVPMEARWQDPEIGHDSISDPTVGWALHEKAALWALEMLQRLAVPAGLRIALALDYPLVDYLREQGSLGPLPLLEPYLSGEQRLALLQLLGACPGISSLLDDPSIEVRSQAKRLLDKE